VSKKAAQERRERYKSEYFPEVIAWTGEKPEVGWFRAPRTLPLLMALLKSKKVSDNTDATSVYLELLSRHRDTGVIEMASETDHSYAAGYPGTRGVRTWQERMRLLEELGFIQSKKVGNATYKYVVLVHPAIIVKNLCDEGKVDQLWLDTYRQMQIETKEASYEQLMKRIQDDADLQAILDAPVKPKPRVKKRKAG
jgi:hypothetical protein